MESYSSDYFEITDNRIFIDPPTCAEMSLENNRSRGPDAFDGSRAFKIYKKLEIA